MSIACGMGHSKSDAHFVFIGNAKEIISGVDIRTVAIALIGIIVLVGMSVCVVIIRRRNTEDPFVDMEGEEFERYCANLLSANGFTHIDTTQGSHDYGIDIFAMKDSVSYAIQCKCYSGPVGIKAVQEAYAGKDYYDCMVGVVMTNQSFTKPAMDMADKLKVLLWDGEHVYKMTDVATSYRD